MAIKDLYGMGKGGAQVVDLRSVDAMVQNQAEANRKRNEAKAQKRATMISAIDSQLGKLKNTSWYGVSGKDRDYIDKLKSDTRIWMTKTYDTHGEAAFLDNPELKRELDEKAAFIESENGRSHASIKQADLMLTKSQKNAEDIDTETGVAFDKWMDLPSEVRMRTPMPIIKDRDLTLRELFIEEGMDKEILSSYIPTERTGSKNPETGEYNKYEGKRTDEDKYNTTINGLNTNTGGKIFGKANRLAMAEIESDALPPFIDVDGEQVPNPEYQDKLNATRKRIIEEIAERFKGTTYENKTRGFRSVKEEKEEKPSGFRTSTGLSSTYFQEGGMEGFTLANPKTGSGVKPILVTVEMPNGEFNTVKLSPSHFIKTPKGNVIKGQAVYETWSELSSTKKAQWKKDNPTDPEVSYAKSHGRGDVVEAIVTASVDAQLKDQYGISGFDSHLEEVKGGKQESQKESEEITW